MDLMLLRIYQRQVVFCCTAVLIGRDDLASFGALSSGRLWYGIQNLIVGAGNLSKTLWGTGQTEQERKRRYDERLPLRESLSVTDDSPLRRVKIRNDYEHLDERIEKWWNESTNHNFIGDLIGPRGSIGGDAITEIDTLRWFDPTTGDVIFWGNELNIPTVVEEAARLLPIAQQESQRPHWDTSAASGGGG